MDNYASPRISSSLKIGTLSWSFPAEMRQQLVAVRDIGEIVARAFDKPEKSVGRTVELAGDELSMMEVANKFTRKLGRPIKYVVQSEDEVRSRMGEDGLRMMRWFKEKGYHVDIKALEKQWDIHMTRFDEYLDTVKWAE